MLSAQEQGFGVCDSGGCLRGCLWIEIHHLSLNRSVVVFLDEVVACRQSNLHRQICDIR